MSFFFFVSEVDLLKINMRLIFIEGTALFSQLITRGHLGYASQNNY
jgi:hypothetical protein